MDQDKRLSGKVGKLREHIPAYKGLWLMTAKADGGALFPVDLLSTAVTHRAMCLISGFCDMIEKQNFICAAPLVRLLLDSLLRFYAVWLVDEPHDLANQIFSGKELRKIKDRNGKKMTDRYLSEQLAKEYTWLERVYRETSGYVHLSSKHYFNTVRELHEDDRSVTVAIGSSDTSITTEVYEEALDAMLEISTAVLRYLHGWAHTKQTEAIATKYNSRKE